MAESTHPHWKALEHAYENEGDAEYLKAFRASLDAMGEKKVGYIPSYFVRRLLEIAEWQDTEIAVWEYLSED